MNKLIFKSKSIVKYFTVEELQNYDKKPKKEEIVLVLENEYFDIVRLNVVKDLDDEEKELVIEGELEQKILNYTPVDFIEKEILLKEDENSEEILIVLLKRETIHDIIKKNINLMNIIFVIPFFLLNYASEENNLGENLFFDMCDNRGLFVTYNEKKIIEVESYFVDREDLVSTELEKENFLEKFYNIFEKMDKINKIYFFNKDLEIKKFFTGENSNKINIISLEEYLTLPQEDLNFIPMEYLEDIKNKKTKKFGIYLFLIIFSIKVFVFLIFSFLENRKENKINIQNNEIAALVKNVTENKEMIENINDYQEKINSLESIIQKKEIKFIEILSTIKKITNKNIYINHVEYKGKNKLQIKGISLDDNSLYEFQEKIDKNYIFTNINHDYIKKVDDHFQFQFDVGVKID